MKKLLWLIGALLCCATASGRPQFIEPTRVLLADGLDFNSADVDGDWILARGLHRENIDPNDPDWTFDSGRGSWCSIARRRAHGR